MSLLKSKKTLSRQILVMDLIIQIMILGDHGRLIRLIVPG